MCADYDVILIKTINDDSPRVREIPTNNSNHGTKGIILQI